MILTGECLEQMKLMPDSSVDSIVTDPPYGLSFMGKRWDYSVPSVDVWREALRVLKPGGHLLSFGGTRTYHRMVVAIEDAGFEIRDQIQWIYGQGFPKSLDVHKALTKLNSICVCEEPEALSEYDLRSLRDAHLQTPINAQDQSGQVLYPVVPKQGAPGTMLWAESEKSLQAGEERGLEGRRDVQEDEGQLHRPQICSLPASLDRDGAQGRVCDGTSLSDGDSHGPMPNADRSGAPQRPQHSEQSHLEPGILFDKSRPQTCRSCGKPRVEKGLGTALKPANEPIVLARKPLQGTVAANVAEHGTGALNIDASRIRVADNEPNKRAATGDNGGAGSMFGVGNSTRPATLTNGRWPANVLFDEEAAEALDAQSGISKSNIRKPNGKQLYAGNALLESKTVDTTIRGVVDSGGASRFFYVAKASKRERNAGLEGMPERQVSHMITGSGKPSESVKERAADGQPNRFTANHTNHHPTVKPIALMEYLIRLVTPPGGTVLDPFMGSGTTGCACARLGFQFIGIEREPEYAAIAEKRIKHWEIA